MTPHHFTRGSPRWVPLPLLVVTPVPARVFCE